MTLVLIENWDGKKGYYNGYPYKVVRYRNRDYLIDEDFIIAELGIKKAFKVISEDFILETAKAEEVKSKRTLVTLARIFSKDLDQYIRENF